MLLPPLRAQTRLFSGLMDLFPYKLKGILRSWQIYLPAGSLKNLKSLSNQMATPEEQGSKNADEELNQMLHDLGTTATLFESFVTKWPRKGNRHRGEILEVLFLH